MYTAASRFFRVPGGCVLGLHGWLQEEDDGRQGSWIEVTLAWLECLKGFIGVLEMMADGGWVYWSFDWWWRGSWVVMVLNLWEWQHMLGFLVA